MSIKGLATWAGIAKKAMTDCRNRSGIAPNFDECAEAVALALFTQFASRPEERAQEPVAWALIDEGDGELLDVLMLKPEEPMHGVRYEPLSYMNSRPIKEG